MSDEPTAGQWVIWRAHGGLNRAEIAKVTPKLIKLSEQTYLRQLPRMGRDIVCFAPNEETSRAIFDQIAGVDGEFQKRARAARKDYNERLLAAQVSRDVSTAKIVAAHAVNAGLCEGFGA